VHGIDWTAVGVVSAPTMALVAWIGRVIARKIDKVGTHLARQDVRAVRIDRRLLRVETTMGLLPLPPDD
jgi:hypothetical protein